MGKKEEISKDQPSSGIGNKISEFFNHLVAYGGFNYNQGELYTFNNPYTFIPLSCLAEMQIELEKLFGEEGLEIIEWLGRVDGRTACLILVKRYGINNKNIKRLLSAGTLTGLGKLELIKYSEKEEKNPGSDPPIARVISTNSPFAIYFKEKYGETKIPVDRYILGALLASDTAIVGKECYGKETKCIAKGDPYCEYIFEIGNYYRPKIIKKIIKVNPDKILEKICDTFLKRIKISKISFKSKNISFGDGKFLFNNIQGISIPMFVLVLYNELIKSYDKKKQKEILSKMAKKYINELKIEKNKKVLSKGELENIISGLEMFGFGHLEIYTYKKSTIILKNSKNNFAKEYYSLFGKQKEGVDLLLSKLIEEILTKTFNKIISVTEEKCISKKDKFCTFKINIK